jgi:hypothetical protein
MINKSEFTRRIMPFLILLIALIFQAAFVQAEGPDEPPADIDNTSNTTLLKYRLSLPIVINKPPSKTGIEILPQQADWKNKGIAIKEGVNGEWDRFLWGGFANSLIKKGDTYFLYYQGSPNYDKACESVSYRSIGVATSKDGITWTKFKGNPIITWASKGSIEEGATSSGAWVGNDGKVYIYYGANSGTGCNVNANGRLATSTDGYNFTDQGQVISGQNLNIWGNGDEIFPIGAYEYQGLWKMFYVPNGVAQSRRLGVVSGNSPTSLPKSLGVNGGKIPVWGTVSTILNNKSSVLFVNDGGTNLPLKAYRFDAADPSNITLEKTYLFPDCAGYSVLFDQEHSRWLLLCTDKTNYSAYHIKIANIPLSTTSTSNPMPDDSAPVP